MKDHNKVQRVEVLLAKLVIEERAMITRPKLKKGEGFVLPCVSDSQGSGSEVSQVPDAGEGSFATLFEAVANIEDLEFEQASRT